MDEETKQIIETLENRIKALEEKKESIVQPIKKEFLPSFDILKVFKLIANLPIYTVARTGTPENGEIWLSEISDTRKINARISGTTYSVEIT